MNDEYLIYGETLTNIANSIRSVSSVSMTWTPDEMAAYILANLVKPTTRQAAKTYTPSTSNQTIPAGTFLTGAATIQGDADWVPGNIKKGVNMWGKTGTLSGIWGDPSTFYGFTAVKAGSFTLTNSSYTANINITHNLGVIPRMIIYYTTTPQYDNAVVFYVYFANDTITSHNAVTGSNKISIALPFRMYPAKGGTTTRPIYAGYANSSYYRNTFNPFSGIPSSGSSDGAVHELTATTFAISSGSNHYLMPATYKWLVMG